MQRLIWIWPHDALSSPLFGCLPMGGHASMGTFSAMSRQCQSVSQLWWLYYIYIFIYLFIYIFIFNLVENRKIIRIYIYVFFQKMAQIWPLAETTISTQYYPLTHGAWAKRGGFSPRQVATLKSRRIRTNDDRKF